MLALSRLYHGRGCALVYDKKERVKQNIVFETELGGYGEIGREVVEGVSRERRWEGCQGRSGADMLGS